MLGSLLTNGRNRVSVLLLSFCFDRVGEAGRDMSAAVGKTRSTAWFQGPRYRLASTDVACLTVQGRTPIATHREGFQMASGGLSSLAGCESTFALSMMRNCSLEVPSGPGDMLEIRRV